MSSGKKSFVACFMVVMLTSAGFRSIGDETGTCVSFATPGAAEAPAIRVARIVADWERAKAYTLDYLGASTDEMTSFRPVPEMRSFAQQMLHLADDNFGFIALATGKKAPSAFGELEKKADQFKTKEALIKVVSDSYDFAIASVKAMDDEKLNEVIKVFRWDISREETLNKAFEHQTHHRGQTTVYLRLKGIKPPEERLF